MFSSCSEAQERGAAVLFPNVVASPKDPLFHSWLSPPTLQPICLPPEPSLEGPSEQQMLESSGGWMKHLFVVLNVYVHYPPIFNIKDFQT